MNEELFNWCGVVVGHWYVKSVSRIGSRFGLTYQCISKCGVWYTIRASDLAGNRIGSCFGCRSVNARTFLDALRKKGSNTGMIPYRLSNAIVPESVMCTIRHRFEEINMVEVNADSLHNRATVSAWKEHAQDVLKDLLARTGLGLNYGWKVRVIDACGNVRNGSLVRLRSANAGIRQFIVAIAPPHSTHAFDVDIRTGRNDNFEDIRTRVKAAIDSMQKPLIPVTIKPENNGTHKEEPKESITPVVTVTPAPTVDTSIERLEKMRSGLDTLLNIARTAKDINATKREIQARLDILKEKAKPALSAKNEALKATMQAEAFRKDTQRQITELNNQLEELNETIAKVGERYKIEDETYRQTQAVLEKTKATAMPFEQEIELAEMELKEAEENEVKRLTSLNLSGDLPTILAALEKLSG